MFRLSGVRFRPIVLGGFAVLVFSFLPAKLLAETNPAAASARPFERAPWLADLEEAREAFLAKYANLDWLENEHEVKLGVLFDELDARMRRAQNDQDARAVFDRLVAKTGDGHVEIEWPQADQRQETGPRAAKVESYDPCSGFDARQNAPGTAVAMPGYASLKMDPGNPFRAGTIAIAGTKVGVLRIGVFQTQGFPELCRTIVTNQIGSAGHSCDEQCQDAISAYLYHRLTLALENRIRELKRAGATILLVDISGNGGGSEWAEAAARIVSRKTLTSERRGMVRGEHWAEQWRELAVSLGQIAAKTTGDDKQQLLGWAAQAEARLRDAETPCASNRACRRIADAGFATGLVGSARSGAFNGKSWGWRIFSPAQFPYHDGVWQGPLIVLVDNETWSAAEEFAAVLQDNRAAVIVGARTGGAGCGHTNGGDPVTLTNSHAILLIPDCVRFRSDGSNEVRGILPNVPVPIRASDGVQFRARLVQQYLPRALILARRQMQ